jgi:serine/threonine protein phosphatase 1
MVIKAVKNLFGKKPRKADGPRVPDGTRYYVVGDIHGRNDLFGALIEAVEADDKASPAAQTVIVLLGDLVDRGADSAGVIAAARDWQRRRKVHILAGNHEEMFLESFDDKEVLRHFLKHGGRETILSYDISPKKYKKLSIDELFDQLPDIVPQEDRDFLDGFDEKLIAGDYLFVHAGINPKRSIEDQTRKDMLWIRDRFLRYEGELPKVVVHGHTIFPDIEDCGSRIGIDTGAFRSGVLTALVLEADTRRAIKAIDEDGTIAITHEELHP